MMNIESDPSQNHSDEEIVQLNQQVTSKLGGPNSQSTQELQKVKNTLKMCKGASGVFNAEMIFNCLNDI